MRAGRTMETPASPDYSNTPAGTHRRVVGRVSRAGPAIRRTIVVGTIDATRGLLAFFGALRPVPVVLRAIVPARVLVSLLTSDQRAPCYQHERYHLRFFHVLYWGCPFFSLLNVSATKRERKANEVRARGDPVIAQVLPHTGRAGWGIPPKLGPRPHRWSAGSCLVCCP